MEGFGGSLRKTLEYNFSGRERTSRKGEIKDIGNGILYGVGFHRSPEE